MWDSLVRVFSGGQNVLRLMEGLWATLYISAASVAMSLVFGLIVGLMMLSERRWLRAATRLYLETVRIIPVLTFLFLLYYLLSRTFHVSLSSLSVALLAFTVWGTAETADLVRGAFASIPKHQRESGLAIGLTETQVSLLVVAPQAARRLLPGIINLVTRMIKTTPLVFFIGIPELVTVSQQVAELAAARQNRLAAFWVFGAAMGIYFLVCFPISKLARIMEERYRF
ncbi:MAG: amino acid ABC transporter permease [Deltaproteobacteria bacterium]|nr:amino acid ABC transporter permease [Deltaproteobacteria bacterium]